VVHLQPGAQRAQKDPRQALHRANRCA
jgi:hypothetical protein